MNQKKPTVLKVLQGTDQPCRRTENEPQPGEAPQTPPFKLCDVAQEYWDKTYPVITKCGLLSAADVQYFAIHCETYANWMQAVDIIRKRGVFDTCIVTGAPELSKAKKSLDADSALMMRQLAELGMTPSARSKVSSYKKEESKTGKWDHLIKKR